MPELLLELFSEEIPARMQARAAEDLARLVAAALAPLAPEDVQTFHGPRRLTLVAQVAAATPETRSTERGPRAGAPEAALAGFLKKHGASRDSVREEGGYLVLDRVVPAVDAATIIARELPGVLRRFPWPKSMRWGGTSSFAWVRPLRRILCVLDGAVVPFDLREGADDGHGLASANETEGHRFMAPGGFAVAGFADYRAELAARHVILDAEERVALIRKDAARLAGSEGLSVVEDPGLVAEIAGLTEWPVGLVGRIDAAFMDLPPEVLRSSMRVNQRYISLRNPDGTAAARFVMFANVVPADGGAAIVAGNERVLRARLADARFFWDQDRRQTLEASLPKLAEVTFHAKLGSQRQRIDRLFALAGELAPLVDADKEKAQRAALLCKADLVTGMVGEFPELQGVMGRYYALAQNEDGAVANAIRDHYAPRGADDDVPAEPVAVALALADRIDTLVSFFGIGARPTGSGDPFALRRAALGLIRIIVDNEIRLDLFDPLKNAVQLLAGFVDRSNLDDVHLSSYGLREFGYTIHTPQKIILDVIVFITDRLRVKLKDSGLRSDIVDAVTSGVVDWDILQTVRRAHALQDVLRSPNGISVTSSYRRTVGILKQAEVSDKRNFYDTDQLTLTDAVEVRLQREIKDFVLSSSVAMDEGRFDDAYRDMARMRPVIDDFFESVTVNVPQPQIRENRLRLLARLRHAMDQVADFSKLEG
jgi:glycyl-tRNA synthetase beta chain